MKKIVSLLTAVVAVALLASSCEKAGDDNGGLPALELISESPVVIPVDGGDYTVEYSIKNAVEGGSIVAEAGTSWVSVNDYSTEGILDFSVDANPNTDARMAQITITYSWPEMDEPATLNVTVQQEAIVIEEIEDILPEIPDPAFKDYCLYRMENTEFIDGNDYPLWDTDGNGKLSSEEAAKVRAIYSSFRGIEDLTGIEYFIGLQTIIMEGEYLPEVDFSSNRQLKKISMQSCGIESVNVSENTLLETVDFWDNSIKEISFKNHPNLTSVNMVINSLTKTDFSGATALMTLLLSTNELESLDLTGLGSLLELDVFSNYLTELDLTPCGQLQILTCSKNYMAGLDLSPCPNLTYLNANTCDIESINFSGNTALTDILLYGNPITSLDVSDLTSLKNLDISGLKIGSIDLSNNKELTQIYVDNCGLTSLDISNQTKMTTMACDGNYLTEIDITNMGHGIDNSTGNWTYTIWVGAQKDQNGNDQTIHMKMLNQQVPWWNLLLTQNGADRNINVETEVVTE